MADLVTWLRAQLDEDERLARRPAPGPWRLIGEPRETRVVSPAGGLRWPQDGSATWSTLPATTRLGGEVDTDEARALLALSYQDRSGRQTAEPPGPRVCQRRDRSRPGPPEPPA